MTKRVFDVSAALLGLLCLSPLFLIVAILIKLDSRGAVFFKQERMGRRFKPFQIYKFRTMVSDAARRGGLLTVGEDPRITRVGRVLRKTKIDELPQLFNVLAGHMSVVGPRPEVPRYVECFKEEYAQILEVRPGITDLASVRFRDEAALLGQLPNPEETYLKSILPQKLMLEKEYIRAPSLLLDLSVIVKTVAALIGRRIPS
jgi:lipopolysaccharide/colanic/teichoic acid biosynthesis glycosyltransferase